MSFKRKLSALKYHGYEEFDINNHNHIKRLVVWLENQRIRHYSIEDRAPLINITSETWEASFKNYLQDLKCPFGSGTSEMPSTIDWLLGLAVRLEYGEKDNVDIFQKITAESVKSNVSKPDIIQKSLLDNLDFQSTEFKAGVDTLARLLNITLHPDHLVTLKAVCNLVRERMNKEAIDAANKKNYQGTPVALKEMNLGFETGDYVLNSAVKVLRLLHIRDLRNLQTKINESIVDAQNITANPKTDTRLGKVGR